MSRFWFLPFIIILNRDQVIASSHSCIFYQIFVIIPWLSTHPGLRWNLWLYFIWVMPAVIIGFGIFTNIFLYVADRLEFDFNLFFKNFLVFLLKLFIPYFFLASPYRQSFSTWGLNSPNLICG